MLKQLILSVLIAAVLLCHSAYAAEPTLTSMRSLIATGLKNNLGLEIEKVGILSSREEIKVEGAVFDTELFATTGYLQSRTPIEPIIGLTTDSRTKSYSGKVGVRKKMQNGLNASFFVNSEHVSGNDLANDLEPYSRTSFIIELTQPLLRNFSTDVNTTQLRIADNRSHQTALAYLLKAQNLTLLLESAVRQLAGEAHVVELRQNAEVLASELYHANRKRFDAGLVPVSEVQEAETALASRQLNLSQAQELYSLNRQSLSRQLHVILDGNFDPTRLVAEDAAAALPDVGIEPMFVEARQKRIEFKISQFAIDSSLLNKSFQENQLKPQLDLTAQAGLNGLSGSERNPVSGSRYEGNWGNSFSSLAEGDGYQWGVGLNFSVPLGKRAEKARVRQAEYQNKQEKYRLQDLEVQVRDQLKQQQVQLRRSYEQLLLAERFSNLAQKTLNQEQRRLDEGLSDTFRMISFQDKMIEAQIGKVNATTRYQSALATMAFLRGDIFKRHGIVLTENSQEINFENM
jgi:outer membrane protein